MGKRWLQCFSTSLCGGRKSKLSDSQLKELGKILNTRESWLVDDVKNLIKEKFDIDYGYHGVRSLLLQLEIPIMTKYEK